MSSLVIASSSFDFFPRLNSLSRPFSLLTPLKLAMSCPNPPLSIYDTSPRLSKMSRVPSRRALLILSFNSN